MKSILRSAGRQASASLKGVKISVNKNRATIALGGDVAGKAGFDAGDRVDVLTDGKKVLRIEANEAGIKLRRNPKTTPTLTATFTTLAIGRWSKAVPVLSIGESWVEVDSPAVVSQIGGVA